MYLWSCQLDKEANKIMAYHEGGHVIVMYYTKESYSLHKATIMPPGPSLGWLQLQLYEEIKLNEWHLRTSPKSIRQPASIGSHKNDTSTTSGTSPGLRAPCPDCQATSVDSCDQAVLHCPVRKIYLIKLT